jgi:O-antigen ligase
MYFRVDVYVDNDHKTRTLYYIILLIVIPMISIIKSYKFIDFQLLLKLSFVFLAIAIILTFFSNSSFQEKNEMRLDANLATGTIGTGHLGLSTMVISFFYLLNKRDDLLKKIIIYFVMILGLIVLLRAGSRGPLLSLIGLVSIFLLSISKKKSFSIFLFILFLVILYFSIDYILYFIGEISPILYERFISKSESGQFSSRNFVYEYAINSFLDSPLLGKYFAIYNGHGGFTYAHNFILDSFMQLGVFGGLLILYITINTIMRIFNVLKSKRYYFWLALILMQNIIGFMVSGAFYFNPTLSILIVLLFLPLDRDNYSLQKINNKV